MFSLGGMGGTAAWITLLLCIVNAHETHKKEVKAICDDEKITIMFTTQFDNIWDDSGSDAGGDLSIWRPATRTTGFFPVGDTAVTSHETPDHAAVLVEDNGNGLVKPPRKFRKIWSDKGSSAQRPVTVYEMVPPSNYTCLGDVAVKSYRKSPKPEMYRCLRVDLVENGDITPIWKSKHFGAQKDVSFWTVRGINSTSPKGLSTGAFLAVKNFHEPVENMYVLNACKVNLTDPETEDQNDHKGHHGHGSDTCKCSFHPGGCTIVSPPPANMACCCRRTLLWTCSAELTNCAQPEAKFCKDPDTSLATCLQGDGNCGAYSDKCDCKYHQGGCKISQAAIPYTACKCIYKDAFGCGGKITRCKDPTSDKCVNPDPSKESCLQGSGDCGAY